MMSIGPITILAMNLLENGSIIIEAETHQNKYFDSRYLRTLSN